MIFDDPEWFFRASPEALAKELATATSHGNPIDGNRATALTSAFFKHREANEKAFVAGIANFDRLADALIGKTKPVGHSVSPSAMQLLNKKCLSSSPQVSSYNSGWRAARPGESVPWRT